MFNWFKKRSRNYPEFWRDYELQFQKKKSSEINPTRFVVFDTETTGFNRKKDGILSIGAIAVQNNSILIADSLELYIQQEIFNPETVEIHGLLHRENDVITEEEAIKTFLKYIDNSVLVAHHAGFDIGMINRAMERLDLPPLKNQILDTGTLFRATKLKSNLIDRDKHYTLDDLAENFSLDTTDRHTATGDAFLTAMALVKILARLNPDGNLKTSELFKL